MAQTTILVIAFGYFLSYLLPILLFIVWAKFLGGKYKPIMGIANWFYFIITLITLTYKHRDIDQFIAVPLLLIGIGVFFLVTYLFAYFTGKIEGVKFWNSFIWKLIKVTGHPLLIYPAVLLISIILDFNFLPIIISKL